MKLYFVRHGHPNYREDRLTELGHKQAQAAAERLKEIPFDGIFASTHGRAMETAQHTAELLNLPVTGCDFIREISWGSRDGTELFRNGNPWFIAWDQIARGVSLQPDERILRHPRLMISSRALNGSFT